MPPRDKILKAQIAEGAKELKAIVVEARREIEHKIIEAAGKGNFARAAAVRDGLYSGIASEYIRLNRGVDDWTRKRASKVASAWHEFAIDDLPEAATGVSFNQFSKKYLDDIIGKVSPSVVDKRVALNARIGGMLAEDVRALRVAVSDTLRKGAITGASINEMSAEMKNSVLKVTPAFKFVDKAGKTWNSDSYFNMFNRTLHSEVSREAYKATVADAGHDLIRVTGTSSYPNSPCIPWQGEVLSLSGTSKKYPSLAEAMASGLFHPNCIHSQSVYVEGID